jgi:hypothetical protein
VLSEADELVWWAVMCGELLEKCLPNLLLDKS